MSQISEVESYLEHRILEIEKKVNQLVDRLNDISDDLHAVEEVMDDICQKLLEAKCSK